MNTFNRNIAALALAAASVLAPTWSHAEQTAPVAPDYTVFVDPPTGFVFLKLPQGWKFVGKVEQTDLARLPQGVVTALLEGREAQGAADIIAASKAR